MTIQVFIAIYRPIDDCDPSHWAIFLHNTDPTAGDTDVILQVSDGKGGFGYFVEQSLYGEQPSNSTRHDLSLCAGTITPGYFQYTVSVLLSVPVNNMTSIWNCRSWVFKALDHIERMGIFQWDASGKASARARYQQWQ